MKMAQTRTDTNPSYGTLLGSTLFETFVSGIVAFKTLPRAQFGQLQKNVFPIYFAGQTILPVVLAITYPPSTTSSLSPSTSYPSIATILDPSNRYSVLLPLSTLFICGLANWAFVGPMTSRTMQLRKHQETRDGKKSFDHGPHSEEMKRLNRRFGILHGVSSLFNVVSVFVCLGYGWHLGSRLS